MTPPALMLPVGTRWRGAGQFGIIHGPGPEAIFASATATSIYGGTDPRELPAYSIPEAAQYLRIPSATLRSWVVGRSYPRRGGTAAFEPLIATAPADGARLSFLNLIEAHVLRGLRTQHGVPLKFVRPALEYAAKHLGIERLLLSDELLTNAGEIFMERYGALINLSRSGQLAMRRVLEAHLRRVERDDSHVPIRLYPFVGGSITDAPRPILIDPRISFGRPTLAGYGVSTSAIAQRIDSGEDPASLAADYRIPVDVIEEAVVFERAA